MFITQHPSKDEHQAEKFIHVRNIFISARSAFISRKEFFFFIGMNLIWLQMEVH